jgi:hypothetical protein
MTTYDADVMDDRLAVRLDRRTVEQPERRQRMRAQDVERRLICGYCFQDGNHPSPTFCRRPLER